MSLLKNGKSPSYDGFLIEYYKEYILAIPVPVPCEVYQEIFRKGQVPPALNEALGSLIPKKDKDTPDPSNFRPISLLNLNCKILTKIPALCLQ